MVEVENSRRRELTACVSSGVVSVSSRWLCTAGLLLHSRAVVDGNRLTILNVKRADAQMLQCNASNIHGYLLASAYLNILGNASVT